MSNYPAGVTDADIDFYFGDSLEERAEQDGYDFDEEDDRDYRGYSPDDARDIDRAMAEEERMAMAEVA